MLQLVDETLASVIKEKATNAAESLCGQELDFGIRLVRIDQTGGMDLDLLQVDGAGANGNGHLLPITSRVIAIGGREFVVFRTVLLEKRI